MADVRATRVTPRTPAELPRQPEQPANRSSTSSSASGTATVNVAGVFHRKGPVNDQEQRGGSNSQSGGGHQGQATSARARARGPEQRPVAPQQQGVQLPTTSALSSIRGINTFDPTPTLYGMRRDFAPGGKFSGLQGRVLKVAGDPTEEEAAQIFAGQLPGRLNPRTYNQDRVEYHIPLRA